MIGKFYINNEDVYTKWGIVFPRGVFSELLKAPKRKDSLGYSWPDAHGTQRDDTPFFESMDYSLRMVMVADNEGDFWTKYISFYDFILTTGYFTFRSADLNKQYTLLYKDMSSFRTLTPLTSSGRVGSEFTLLVVNDFTGTNVGGKPAPASPTLTVTFASTPTFATSSYTNLKYEKHSMIHFEWDDASRDALAALAIFAGRTFTDGAGNTKLYALAVAVNGRAQYDNREVGLNSDLGITYEEGLQIIQAGGDIENHSMYHDPTGNYNNGSDALLNVQQLEQLYYERTGYRMNALVVPTDHPGFMQAAFDEGYVAASSESTFDGFTAQPTGFGATGDVSDIPAGFIPFDRQFTDDWGARLVDFKSYIDELLTGTSATVNRWFRIGSHNLTNQTAFTDLINYLQTQGADRIWVTTMREFAEYRIAKAQTVKTEQLVGNTLTITLDQSAISDRIRWRDLTLKINSDAAIQSVTIDGVDGGTYNTSTGLVNVFKQKLTFASGTTQLTAPVLSLSNITASQIQLDWTAPANATGYVVERSLDGSTGWASIYTGGLLTYTDTGRSASTTYYYRVKATASGYTDSAYGTANATTSAASGETYTIEQTILVNFANEFFGETASGRNNFLPTNTQASTQDGFSMADLVDAVNIATTVDMAIGAPFGGAANSTAAASGGLQIYTDLMVNSALTLTNSAADATLVISGLDDTKYYHFYILGASNVADTSTKWTIGAANETKVTSENYPLASNGDKYTNPAIVRIINVQPMAGAITIAARKMGIAWENIGISVLEIERSNIAKV